ncbi:hypothetical protein A2Z00_00380 [Candidatus Gottesmanbacteria bacterium RBG_13_45_10]|uniref:Uncharacterized protein n=1 Tax=Candidatus Gottesmanbacteria bacterium RBG_13_45_10 TaxID=1798370 RepID=A0A1F5ZG12_9BACT|nr:MAG: hypothetical protein A2Z00_00380 [Candidatus Gottesmanbacteria bacterium RBG_13_45_10]
MNVEQKSNIDTVAALVKAVANLTLEHSAPIDPNNPIRRDATRILGEEAVQMIELVATTNARLRTENGTKP